MALKAARTEGNEAFALCFQGVHAFLPAEGRSCVKVKVYPVLGGLALWNSLKIEPRPPPVRIFERGGTVVLLLRDARFLEEVVPGGQTVVSGRKLHTRRCRVEIAQRCGPEGREGSWVASIKSDLNRRAHEGAEH